MKEVREIENIPVSVFDLLLTNFFMPSRKQNGSDHDPASLRWLRIVSGTHILITTPYHLMLQSWYQKTAQALANTLLSFSLHSRLP